MFWYYFFPSIIVFSSYYYKRTILLNCLNLYDYIRRKYLKYKPSINTILITNNEIYYNANIFNLLNYNQNNINGIIIDGNNRGLILTKNDIQQKIEELDNKYSSILSATLINDKNEIDITNNISKYIYKDHCLTYEKLILLLNYNKLYYNRNSIIKIMDNNTNEYELILDDKPNIKIMKEDDNKLLNIYFI